MTGWKSKQMLTDRDLVDDIITLRRQLAEAERQRDNALDALMVTRRELDRLREAIVREYEKTDQV